MSKNDWKNNKSTQDTTSTPNQTRAQDSYNPSVPVTDAASGKSSKTSLVVDETQAA